MNNPGSSPSGETESTHPVEPRRRDYVPGDPLYTQVLQRLAREKVRRGHINAILDEIVSLFDAERIFLFRLRQRGGFRVLSARDRDRDTLKSPHERVSHYAIKLAMAATETYYVKDARRDRRYRTEEALRTQRMPVSIMVHPLHLPGGSAGGVYLDNRFNAIDFQARAHQLAPWLALLETALRLRDQTRQLHRYRKDKAALARSHPAVETAVVERAEERFVRQYLENPPQPEEFHGLLSANPDMRDLFATVRQAAASDIPVLIYGETGTGKGLLAQAVHTCSARGARELRSVHCGAIPGSLVESELMGHVKGAFTGADTSREGVFVAADGGTLLLDEIGDVDIDFQTKLLRTLEEGEVRPLGAKQPRNVDVRIIAASRHRLDRLVHGGSFRRDLYFRLKGMVLEIPPLRERREDVLPLARKFLDDCAAAEKRRVPVLLPAAQRRLLIYPWPGNVRELMNEMRRLVAMRVDRINEQDLALSVARARAELLSAGGHGPTLAETVGMAERQAVLGALEQARGNKSQAAEQLGITRKSLYRRLRKYGINK